jgi:multiple sugar transport system substrate-binding protein
MYPDLVRREAILPLDGLVPEVEAAPYLQGLADLWVAEDGKRYGMLKDWSTTAVFYNKEMLARAGVSDEAMSRLTWTPGDGGTFEQIIAKLTVDANGVRGHEKGFDKDHVVTYGLGLDTEDAIGLVEWGFLAHTLGWSPTDRSPWGTHYTFDDPRFRSVMAWGRGLVEKGYLAPPDPAGASDAVEDFPTGRFAMVASTARMLTTYTTYDGIQLGIAATPTGPNGERGSMISSRADSIAAGTNNREDAAKWVAFLGSAQCQDIVGQAGVVLPAVPSALRKAEKAFAAEGIDVSPFTVHLKAETTFLVPVTEKAEQVAAIIEPALTAVITGEAPPGSLTAANATVNALFE